MKGSSFFQKTGDVLYRALSTLFRKMAERYYDPDDYNHWYNG